MSTSTRDIHDLADSLFEGRISRRDFARRATALGLSAGVLGSVLQALGGASSAEAASKATITLWHGWTGADNTQMLNTVIDRFNKTNASGVTVKPTAYQWDQLFSKWVISAASGNPPDVTMFHTSELPEYVERGILGPIDDLVRTAGVSFAGVPSAAVNGVHWKGKLYAVPGDLHPLGMYYNVDMVKAAGLNPGAPPKTMAEFLHWADKLTIRGSGGKVSQYGVYMASTGAVPRWFWYSLLYQFGGSFLNGRGTSAVDSAASRSALQFVVDLFHRYKVVTPGSTGQGIDPVAAKKAAIWFIGPWEVNLRMQQKLHFATAPMPVFGAKPAAWANAHCQGISRQRSDSNYEADITFMKWFYENYAQAAKVVGIIPVNPVARASAVWVDDVRYKYYKAFIEELPHVALEPAFPQYTKIFSFAKPTPLSTNLEAAIAGSKTVDQALRDMKQGVDQMLAQSI